MFEMPQNYTHSEISIRSENRCRRRGDDRNRDDGANTRRAIVYISEACVQWTTAHGCAPTRVFIYAAFRAATNTKLQEIK